MKQEMINKTVENLGLEKFIQVENYRPQKTFKVFVVSKGKFEGLWAEGKSEMSALTLLNNLIYERLAKEVA